MSAILGEWLLGFLSIRFTRRLYVFAQKRNRFHLTVRKTFLRALGLVLHDLLQTVRYGT